MNLSPRNDAAPLAGGAGVTTRNDGPMVEGFGPRKVPLFVARMEAIRGTGTKGAERAVMQAAIRWAGTDGRLWPSAENWAAVAGVTVRTLQRALRRLEARGLVNCIRRSSGGANQTSVYLIVPFVANPDTTSGSDPAKVSATPTQGQGSTNGEPRQLRPETPTAATPNPDGGDLEPRRTVTQSSIDQQVNQPTTTGGVVVALLPSHLIKHQNATPERLDWIEREAPFKSNPGAWAAACIREGWKIPDPRPLFSTGSKHGAARAHSESNLTRFDAMTPAERAPIIAKARRMCPALFAFGVRNADESVVRAAYSKAMNAMAAEGEDAD